MRFFKFISVVLFAVVGATYAQANDLRPMTLQECVQLAIKYNFDVQIRRIDPEIARFNLAGSYAYYVPSAEGAIIRSSNTREGGVNNQTGTVFPPNISESE